MMQLSARLGARLLASSQHTSAILFKKRLTLAGEITPTGKLIFAGRFSFCSNKPKDKPSKPQKNETPDAQKPTTKTEATNENSSSPKPQESKLKQIWAKIKLKSRNLEAYDNSIPGCFYMTMSSFLQNKQDRPINLQKAEDQKILELYGKQSLNVPKSYVKDNSIEQQFKKLLLSEDNQLRMIVGFPGSGKTSAIRHLVQELRKKGEREVYYIDLRPAKQDQGIQSTQILSEHLEKLTLAIGRRQSKKRNQKAPLVFIDDINQIQKKEKSKIYDIETQTVKMACSFARVYAISSSSRYIFGAQENSVIQKSGSYYAIQPLTKSQKAKVLEKLIEDQGLMDFGVQHSNQDLRTSKEFRKIFDYLTNLKLNFRRIKEIIQAVKLKKIVDQNKPNDPNRLSSIEQLFDAVKKQAALMQLTVGDLIKPKFYQLKLEHQLKKSMLEGILSFGEDVDLRACSKLIQFIQAKQIFQDTDIAQGVKYLKTTFDNYLVQCHPRSGMERRIFETLLERQRKHQSRKQK